MRHEREGLFEEESKPAFKVGAYVAGAVVLGSAAGIEITGSGFLHGFLIGSFSTGVLLTAILATLSKEGKPPNRTL